MTGEHGMGIFSGIDSGWRKLDDDQPAMTVKYDPRTIDEWNRRLKVREHVLKRSLEGCGYEVTQDCSEAVASRILSIRAQDDADSDDSCRKLQVTVSFSVDQRDDGSWRMTVRCGDGICHEASDSGDFSSPCDAYGVLFMKSYADTLNLLDGFIGVEPEVNSRNVLYCSLAMIRDEMTDVISMMMRMTGSNLEA